MHGFTEHTDGPNMQAYQCHPAMLIAAVLLCDSPQAFKAPTELRLQSLCLRRCKLSAADVSH
jgi:hypothetical protein